MMGKYAKIGLLSACSAISFYSAVAHAEEQQKAPAASTDAVSEADILVTARKRTETALSIPVVVQALSAKQLETRGINSLEGFGRTVPALMLGDAAGATQGVVALRGIAGGESSPFGESAVSFEVDGVSIARASVRRMSELDLAQIEILKGPQALYSGKNSAAGIIVINSADPTPQLEAGAKLGYEIYSKEWRGEGYVSAPLTDSLGIRIAGMYSDKEGYITNVATPSAQLGPRERHPGWATTYGGRITLKFDNGGPFSAKFKLSASELKGAGADGTAQHVNCPYGVPHASTATVNGVLSPANLGGPDTCKADDTIVRADVSPKFATLWPAFGDGVPRLSQFEMISGLALNYDIADFATLTSQTGYYKMNYHTISNFAGDDTIFPAQNFGSDVYLNVREWSEDLHLASKLDGPINFILGFYYQDQKLFNSQISAANANTPALLPGYPNASTLHNKTESVYGSVSFKPIETVEISGGGRYTHETQNYAAYLLKNADGTIITDIHGGNLYNPALPGGTARPKVSYNNFSPEVTISWRPTSKLTAFAAYKQGFLAGGFQTGSGNLALDQSYGQEIVKGFEAGIKGLVFDNALRFDLSVFNYKITGQQVSATIFRDGASVNLVSNAATSRVKGVELNASWTTPIEGLCCAAAVPITTRAIRNMIPRPVMPARRWPLAAPIQAVHSTRIYPASNSSEHRTGAPSWVVRSKVKSATAGLLACRAMRTTPVVSLPMAPIIPIVVRAATGCSTQPSSCAKGRWNFQSLAEI